MSCDGFRKKSVKSNTDTGYGYVPQKAHVQNNLIEFFCGHALFTAGKIWFTHKPTIMCHLTLARFVLTR